ncbi:MAG TPA: transglutaminase domain-containing protein [Nitrospirae bacterium]|nr:transglutaminase domain-containing protein [Nitrospirota bacterium]
MFINRNTFLLFVIVCLVPVDAAAAIKNPFHTATPTSGIQSGKITIKVTIDAPSESHDVKAWIPYPVTDQFQKIEDVKIEGNFDNYAVLGQNEPGNIALYAEWNKPKNQQRYVLYSFKVTAKERLMGRFSSVEPGVPQYISKFIKSTKYIPIGGKIGELSKTITKGKKTIAQKHKAIFTWIVENTHRDPGVQGCGLGIVERTLASKSGKCADLSSVYVALARGAGIPAREVFGLRLGKKDGSTDMTKGNHCWAEYYQPGYGWVQTDPADVTKLMFIRNIKPDQAGDISDYYVNNVDQYRIVLGRGGRGIFLNPRQSDGTLNYFMYPYAEIEGKSLEWLAAQKKLKYSITFTKTQ